MDFDDSLIPQTPDRAVLVHPTLAPLAAGLAIGEKLGASGRDFLTAFLVGFEVECRISEAIHPDHWKRGFHTSNTIGVFGAAMTAAKLMGLASEKVRNALGIAASTASGLMVNFGTMVKPLHVGRAAESGIASAQMAGMGYTAHPEALEGPKGFFYAFAGGFDIHQLRGRLGRPFSVLRVSTKPYPCGVVGHPIMDGAKSLIVKHDIRPEEVEGVRIATGSHVLSLLRYQKAENDLQAKFCIPFQVASIILRRKAGVMEFTDDFVRSSAAQKMMERVEAVADPAIEALGMDKTVTRIEIRLQDGRVLQEEFSKPYRGGPGNPFSPEDLKEKFDDCVQRVLKPPQGARLRKAIASLEDLDSVGALAKMASVP
jgi:2-methylcitrate dehydratase PrpD